MKLFRLTRVIAAVLLTAGMWPANVWSWGPLGHRVISRMAEARLSPAAAAAVHDLLDPGETFVDAALWPDLQRQVPRSGPWHYVNVPISEPRYNPSYCPADGCVVSKIAEFREMLRGHGGSRAERQVALRFLIHMIEDVHTPIHVGGRDDRGGNDLQVRFFGEGSNLHQVWDWRILERHARSEDWLLRELEEMAPRFKGVSGGNETDWANESLAAAREAYTQPGTGAPLRPGTRLGRAYYDRAVPVVQARLIQAALRVAAVLNSVFERR
jgi:nuclease S1